MIQWLNNNSGAVLALLTAAYVICTVMLCLFAWHTNKTTRTLHLDVQRPFVVCDFHTVHTVMYFRVRNLGPQSACDVNISVDEDPPSSDMWKRNPVITSGIALLSPAQELLFLYQCPAAAKLPRITFTTCYRDATGRHFSETYAHDLSMFLQEDLGRENNDPLVMAVCKIGKQLEALVKCRKST